VNRRKQGTTPRNTQHPQQTEFHAPVGLEPANSASLQLQTHNLDRVTTGIDTNKKNIEANFVEKLCVSISGRHGRFQYERFK